MAQWHISKNNSSMEGLLATKKAGTINTQQQSPMAAKI